MGWEKGGLNPSNPFSGLGCRIPPAENGYLPPAANGHLHKLHGGIQIRNGVILTDIICINILLWKRAL